MNRRGVILLELLVALAILVLAASILLSTFGDVSASIDRGRIASRAADLARTRMSEIELGLVAVEDLRGAAPTTSRASDSTTTESATGSTGAGFGDAEEEFAVDASVSRSAFDGLSLVELRVFHRASERPAFVLRQLVAMPGTERRPTEVTP